MCVLFIAYKHHPHYPLIVLANRDEFYDRPTVAASYWEDHPEIYGGRDLVAGGTWLGVTTGGRFAAVTNYRDPSAPKGTRSRGDLVLDFLTSAVSGREYLEVVEGQRDEFSGFNLLVGELGDRNELFYFSNRSDGIRELSPGVYGLSNHLLDTPWPKVVQGRTQLEAAIRSGQIVTDDFFHLLSDRSTAADEDLPATGVPYEAEKALSAIFIETPGYGTRCSTVLRFDEDLRWQFEERTIV